MEEHGYDVTSSTDTVIYLADDVSHIATATFKSSIKKKVCRP